MAPVQYHRRFSAHFISKESDYDPLILCYNIKEKKLEVRLLIIEQRAIKNVRGTIL